MAESGHRLAEQCRGSSALKSPGWQRQGTLEVPGFEARTAAALPESSLQQTAALHCQDDGNAVRLLTASLKWIVPEVSKTVLGMTKTVLEVTNAVLEKLKMPLCFTSLPHNTLPSNTKRRGSFSGMISLGLKVLFIKGTFHCKNAKCRLVAFLVQQTEHVS